MRKLLRSKRGEGYIDVCIIVMVVIMILALFTAAAPVMTAKMQLDNFADELVREAEISGRIGTETTSRARAQRAHSLPYAWATMPSVPASSRLPAD